MVPYLGDFAEDQSVFLVFNTFDSNDPSASVTITNLVDTDIHIHKNDGTTQHSSATDVDVQIDFDTITGNHMVEIRTTDVFFTTGADYFVRMEGTTVDGATINAWIGHFSIENRFTNVTKVSGTSQTANDNGADINAILVDTADIQPKVQKLLYGGPRGPGVYFDDTAANTSTTLGTDGIPDNPVSSVAAAKTIGDALGTKRIYLTNDSTATLAATMEDYEFIGIGDVAANTVALASQDVDNAYMENVLISGAQGGTGRFMAHRCALSTLTSLEVMAWECAIVNNLTVRQDSYFDKCWSAVAGNGTPTLDINSVANVNVSWRHYSGGLQVNNAVSTTTMSYETDGQLIIDATCTSLTISVRGNCTITDNGTTTSLTQDAAMNRAGALANLDASVAAVETDTQDIQSRLPAALVSGRMSSDSVAVSGSTAAADNLEAAAEVIVVGTAQTGTLSITQMSTDLSEATDDHYIGRTIIWTSGALLGQATDITDYAGTNGVLTFTAVTDAPSNGDTFVIV